MTETPKNEHELQEAFVVIRKKKFKKKTVYIAVTSAIIVAILIMVFVYGYNAAKQNAEKRITAAQDDADYWRKMYDDLKAVPVVLDPVTPEIVQDVLSSKTIEISELATAEYVFTNAARFTDTAHIIKMFDWMTKHSFVQKWDGRIKAGVAMDTLHISIQNHTITITMPMAEILSYEIDYDSIEVLDEKNNIFNPITVNDKVNFDKETKEAMIQRAIENGLLEKAQENAKHIISNLLTASLESIQDYQIEFVVTDQ